VWQKPCARRSRPDRGELSDPRIDFCYVSEVALNPGGKSARVYVAIDSAVKDVAKAEANTIADSKRRRLHSP